MRAIDELDHYELLEISRTASTAEIERAYRLSQQTYGEGSLALYSVFESGDASAIREKLDEACRVLSDPELRVAYDENRLKEGDKILFATFGAGFTWGGAVLNWTTAGG